MTSSDKIKETFDITTPTNTEYLHFSEGEYSIYAVVRINKEDLGEMEMEISKLYGKLADYDIEYGTKHFPNKYSIDKSLVNAIYEREYSEKRGLYTVKTAGCYIGIVKDGINYLIYLYYC